MATGIATPDPKPASRDVSGSIVQPGAFIDAQLQRTRRQVKLVEVAGGLLTLAVAGLAFFLAAAILDHWIVNRGLGHAHRWILLLVLLGSAGYYFAKKVAPVLWGRVNPIYAAQAIERSRPTLKNSLINFLLFRRQRTHVPQVVFQALEQQAATKLVDVSVDTAVDRSRLVQRGYVLVALSAAFALYLVLSPKSPLTTMRRLLAPWADVPAPSRVSIVDISPGDTTAFRGHAVDVSAELLGVSDRDEVRLVYSSSDRQITERVVPMSVPPGGYRYVCKLPEGNGGIQQDLEYRIEAGDAVSRVYRIEAVAAPAIMVTQVQYRYPSYTGLAPVVVEKTGDLKGLEGTEVVIKATANQPIAAASIDLNCDGTLDRSMKVDGQNATITLTLGLNPSRTGPLFDSYQIRFTNEQNVANPEPIRHHVEVIPDLPPEIRFVAPELEELEVPIDSSVALEVQAIDPDFGLQNVNVQARNDQRQLIDKLKGELVIKAPHRGPLTRSFDFVPGKFGAKVGDVIHYRATAVDTKSPQPNQASTAERRIRVIESENKQPRQGANQETVERGQPMDPQNAGDDSGQDHNQHQRQNQSTSPDRSDNQRPEQQQPRDRDNNSDRNQERQDSGQESAEPSEQQKRDRQNQQDRGQQGSDGEQGESGQNSDSKSGEGKSGSGSQKGAQPDSGGEQGGEAGSEGGAMGEQSGTSDKDGQRNDRSGQSNRNDGSKGDSSQTNDSAQSGGDPAGDDQSAKGQQRSSGGTQQRGDESSPVPTDPEHDGEGIERILEHQRRQQGNSGQTDRQEQPAQPDGASSGQDQSGQSQAGSKTSEKSGEEQRSGGEQHSGESRESGSDTGDKQRGKSGEDQQSRDAGNQRSQEQNSGRQRGDQSNDGEKGPGGESSNEMTPSQQAGSESGKQQQDQGNADPSGGDKAGQSGERQPQPDPSETGQPQRDGESAKPDSKQGDQSAHSSPMQKHGQEPDSNQEPGSKKQPDPEKGSESRGPSQTDPSTGSPMGQKQPQESSGAGGDQRGSPMTDQGIRPEQEQSGQPKEQGSENQDGESPSTSRDESKTQGQDKGDRSGDGDKGGGQKSDQPGMNTPGQNSPSDQGAGQSEEEGSGEKSDLPGDQKSDQKTGRPGDERGQGSASRPSGDNAAQQQEREGQSRPGKEPPDRANGQKRDPSHSPNEHPQEGQSDTSSKSGQPKAADGRSRDGQKPGFEPGEQEAAPIEPDDPNLEYAKKATELALKHLKDAMRRSDGDKLLKDLGWSRDDAEQFIRRQEERLSAAARANPSDKQRREAEDVLRSLGIRNPSTSRMGVSTKSDRQHGLSSDRRTAPPPEYREHFRAFSQGINQAD